MSDKEQKISHDGCPSDRAWSDVAAGIAAPEDSSAKLEHAASCESCADALREALEFTADEEDSAQVEVTRNLASAGRAWQSSVAQKITSGLVARDSVPGAAWRWWLASAVGLAAAGCALVLFWTSSAGSPEPELAKLSQVYSETRPFEFRISGAAYGPVRVERGGGMSAESPMLLDVETRISRRLERGSGDPAWLRAQGLADLLEGRYRAAIDPLQRAQSKENTPETRNDLAVAYLLLTQPANDRTETATAIALLDGALASDQGNPVYLFNRALALELKGSPGAAGAWREYLRREPSGPWAQEAQERLRHLEQSNP
jgi:tetratricopeptide (TPR) repeat protein